MDDLQKILITIIMFFVVMMYMRWRNGKKSRDNILCEFATDEGTGYTEFHPVKEGILVINPTKKRAGAEYPVGNVNTIIVDYPEHVPGFLSFIQVKAKKSWFDEQTAEPVLNRSPMLMLSPQRLYNKDRERYTGLAAGQSISEVKEREDKNKSGGKSSGISWGWIVILAVIFLAVAGYIVAQDYIGASNAALGLP